MRTCVPRPSRNFPPVASCSSHAVAAVTNGLRGNATATPVDSSRPGAACDATAALRYAVRPVSVNSSPENPAACVRRARSPILSNGCGIVITSTCTVEQYAGRWFERRLGGYRPRWNTRSTPGASQVKIKQTVGAVAATAVMFSMGAVSPASATSNIQVEGVQETLKDMNGPLIGYMVTGLEAQLRPVPTRSPAGSMRPP